MPSRIIRGALLASDRFLSLPDNTCRMCYVACLLTADDPGNFEAGPGALVRLWRDFGIDSTDKASKVATQLVDSDLIRFYEVGSKRYAHVPRFKQQLRHWKRVCPPSPWTKLPNETTATPIKHIAPAALPRSFRVAEVEVEVEVKQKALSGRPDAIAILQFLNEKAKRDFQPVEANLKLIAARLKEGYTTGDLKMIIANRCRAWLTDDKMREYLRPATLFNATNCAQYRGELVSKET